MRNGILGTMIALFIGAGVSWGQFPPGGPVGGPSVIPPQIPGYQGYGPGDNGTPPEYPPPGNWDQFNPSGPAAGTEGQVPRYWVTAEYLMWFPKSGQYVAPLVTTSSIANRGVIGNPTTQIVNGNDNVDFGLASGYRLSVGSWLDASGRIGWDLSGFSTQNSGETFVVGSTVNSNPVIARPFTNSVNNGQGSYVVASPNFATGYVLDTANTLAWGVGANMLLNLFRSAPESNLGYSLTLMGGFRFFQLSENVNLISSTNVLPGNTVFFNNQAVTALNGPQPLQGRVLGPLAVGFQQTTTVSTVLLNLQDQYQARNSFYGGDLGIYQQFNMGRWTLGMTTKVALGGMTQAVDVAGFTNLQNVSTSSTTTTVVRNGATIFTTNNTSQNVNNNVAAGSVYAQSNSIGHYERNVFVALPEVSLRLGYTFTPSITGFLGYNALYVSRVVRATDLNTGFSDAALNPTSPTFGNPTTPRSFNPFPESDYWLQGLTFGFNVRF